MPAKCNFYVSWAFSATFVEISSPRDFIYLAMLVAELSLPIVSARKAFTDSCEGFSNLPLFNPKFRSAGELELYWN